MKGKYIPPDPNQMSLELKFKRKFEEYVESTKALAAMFKTKPEDVFCGSDIAACHAVAGTIKSMMEAAGIETKQMPDLINAYFGRSAELAAQDEPGCLKPMTLAMWRNYMSKPAEYRLPGYLFFAVQEICRSLELSRLLAAPQGGMVITSEDNMLLLEAKVSEQERHLKELKAEIKRA